MGWLPPQRMGGGAMGGCKLMTMVRMRCVFLTKRCQLVEREKQKWCIFCLKC